MSRTRTAVALWVIAAAVACSKGASDAASDTKSPTTIGPGSLELRAER